jgi:uncharacterized protein (DUF305 family)
MPDIFRSMSTQIRNLAFLGALLFAGCSSGSAAEDTQSFNNADQKFVQEMIPHHEQAVVMSEMVGNVEVSGETAALATDIIGAQAREIESMKNFLSEWGVEFNPNSDPHAGHMMSADESHGMMTDEELAELEDSSGINFEKMWLTMMRVHHEGAIKMATTVIADGKDARVKVLAEAIISKQQKEIELIDSLLAKVGG